MPHVESSSAAHCRLMSRWRVAVLTARVDESNGRTVQEQPPLCSGRKAQATPLRPCMFRWCPPRRDHGRHAREVVGERGRPDVVRQPDGALQRKPEHRGQRTRHQVDERPDAGGRPAPRARVVPPPRDRLRRRLGVTRGRASRQVPLDECGRQQRPESRRALASGHDERADHLGGVGRAYVEGGVGEDTGLRGSTGCAFRSCCLPRSSPNARRF